MDNKKNDNGLEALEQLWQQLTPTQQHLMLRRAEVLVAKNELDEQANQGTWHELDCKDSI